MDKKRATTNHHREAGLILPSVLIVLAFASAIVMMMISLQDIAIQRSRRFSEAAQAHAYAAGGELSAIVALRRDGETAADTDNLTEPWAKIGESDTQIENGTFSLAVQDEQAFFNINNLSGGNPVALQTLRNLLAALRLPVGAADNAAAIIAKSGPITDLKDLDQAGLSETEIAILSKMVVALPKPTRVNINTAVESLIAIVLQNPTNARLLVSRRDKRGMLTADDVEAARVILPVDFSYTSDFFRVEVVVTVDDTSQSLSSLLQRARRKGPVSVDVIARSHIKAALFPAPPD